ncbi:hypothetical protein Tsubulata_050500 [Turnera subulata]|uniref:Uncharacterized protein n=1 Tax=Turnera subulata TaxID=218843 RepID=A0A9Q0GEM9_9ROSI|nr:hypothetical protein Tsubulata_050500 [Turnera subulata]
MNDGGWRLMILVGGYLSCFLLLEILTFIKWKLVCKRAVVCTWSLIVLKKQQQQQQQKMET